MSDGHNNNTYKNYLANKIAMFIFCLTGAEKNHKKIILPDRAAVQAVYAHGSWYLNYYELDERKRSSVSLK